MERISQLLESYFDEMVRIRRHLHQNPELSFQEKNTAKLIADFHKELGHDVRINVGGGGVVAKLIGSKPGKTVALRADFDALAVQEDADIPYKSTVEGVMHACGHDGHTALLLGLAKAFNTIKRDIEGNIVFIHQHAEEHEPGGAIAMIEDGCLDGVDVIFGTHLWATEPLGDILYGYGPFMAAADSFEIQIQGKGGHGAQPHLTQDAIVIGAQVVTNLQQIVSRRVNPIEPAVLSVGSFVADNASNVIADKAILKGTVRTFNEHVRIFMEKEIERIIKGITIASDAEYTYSYDRGYPAVINHVKETDILIDATKKVSDVKMVRQIEPVMAGEDFSYYLQHVKGTFFFTGAKNPTWEVIYPHHHPKFDIDERAMLIGAKTLASATLHFLENE